MLRAFLAAIAAFLLFLGLLFYVVLTASSGQAADGGLSGAPTQEALDDIPPRYLALYQKAATSQSCHVPWAVLAGIGKVESDHGRLDAPGVKSGHNPWGAAGPMQFGALPGSAAGDSWSTYGVDGNGDGVADVYDPADAIPAAANYLCAHGAGAGTLEAIRDALYAYNHAWWYVDDVLSWARRYAQSSTSAPAQAAIAWAKQHLGTPYYWGGTCTNPTLQGGPGNCDCSSLVQQAYAHAGITLGRTTYEQVHQGALVSPEDLAPGDLLFTNWQGGQPQHVVMYIGNNQVIHAPRTGDVVKIAEADYYIAQARVIRRPSSLLG